MLGQTFWEGHVVDSLIERADGSLLLKLTEDPEMPARCGGCRQECVLIHERQRRFVRERDGFDRRVWLDVPIRRMDCLTAGHASLSISAGWSAVRASHSDCVPGSKRWPNSCRLPMWPS